MNSLLPAGVVVLAYVVGRVALGRRLAPSLRRSACAYHTLAFVLGVALLTLPLTVLAVAGLFQVTWLGALGWIAAIAILVCRPSFPRMGRRLDAADAITLIASALFIVAAALGRDATLGAGRDQQVYAEAAIALSERGNAGAQYEPLDDADRALLSSVSGVLVPDMIDSPIDANQPMTLAHPLGWPVWLAIAHATFGMEGVYAANAVVFALGGILFFILLRRLVQPGIAVAATLLLFALPSSLWIAGISLSEPLAMVLLLAVPLFGLSGPDRSRWPIALILTSATLIRVDAALGVPATLVAVLIATSPTPRRVGTNMARRFALTQCLGLAVAVLAYCALFPAYVRALSEYVAIISVASLALTLTAFLLSPGVAAFLRRVIDSRIARLTTVSALIFLFVYAALIRPTLLPFSIIQQASSLDGKRDFREDSILNLATYLSWPILLAALGGVCYAFWRGWATRGGMLRPLVLLLGVGPALLYLWFPHVSPDHPWAFRRFVPTIVPYTILFAAIFVNTLTHRIGRAGAVVGPLALVAPIALVASEYRPAQLLFRENDGISRQIAAIARALPDELTIATGVDVNVAAALFVAYGKPVVVIKGDLAAPDDFAQVSQWIEAKAKLGRPAWLLHGPEIWRAGAKLSQQAEWTLQRQFLVPSDRAPATTIATQRSQFILTRVDGLDPSFATRMFGGDRSWGAPEGGFFAAEVASFGLFRYTDGLAWIDVPAEALRDAVALKVDLFSYAKEGERRWLHVLVNEQPAWSGSVDPGISTLRIPVPKPGSSDVSRIVLLSQAVDPAEMSASDPRTGLSIGLIGIRPLHAGEPVANGPGMQGFRSELALVSSTNGPIPVPATGQTIIVLDVRNAGTAYWPSERELGTPAGAVQIALGWYRRDQSHSFVGENRCPMMISLLAGDHTRLRVPLAPIGFDGKPLPPDEYQIRVGMLRDGEAFAADGDAVLSIPAVVTP